MKKLTLTLLVTTIALTHGLFAEQTVEAQAQPLGDLSQENASALVGDEQTPQEDDASALAMTPQAQTNSAKKPDGSGKPMAPQTMNPAQQVVIAIAPKAVIDPKLEQEKANMIANLQKSFSSVFGGSWGKKSWAEYETNRLLKKTGKFEKHIQSDMDELKKLKEDILKEISELQANDKIQDRDKLELLGSPHFVGALKALSDAKKYPYIAKLYPTLPGEIEAACKKAHSEIAKKLHSVTQRHVSDDATPGEHAAPKEDGQNSVESVSPENPIVSKTPTQDAEYEHADAHAPVDDSEIHQDHTEVE
jgi:hypothetical protein